MRRTLLIAVIVCTAVPVALLLCGWVWLESPFAERWAADRVVRMLADSTGGEVSLDEIDLRPLRGEALVRGLVVRAGASTVESLDVSSALVRVSRFELLRRRVRVTSVDAERVVVRLRGGAGSDEPRELDLTPVSRLRRVRVADGELFVADENVPYSVDARGLKILGAPAGPGQPGGRGQVEAGPVELEIGALPRQEVERATARFVWALPRIHVSEYSVGVAGGRLEGDLTVGLTRTGIVLRGGAIGSLRGERVLPAPVPEVKGELRVWSSFRAAVPGEWEVSADVEDAAGLEALGTRWRGVRANVELGPGHVVLNDLAAESAGGSRVDAVTLHVEGDDWSVEGSGRVRIPELLERLSLDESLARGTASVEVAASGSTSRETYRWTLDGSLDAETTRSAAMIGSVSGRGGPEGSTIEYGGGWGDGVLDALVKWNEPLPWGPWKGRGTLSAATGDAARPLLARLLGQASEKGLELPAVLVPDPRGGLELSASAEGDGGVVVAARLAGEVRDPETAGVAHERLEIGVDWTRASGWTAAGRLADSAGRGVRARAASAAPGDATFSVHVDDLPLDVVPRLLDEPPGWLLDAEGSFEGEFSGVFRGGIPRARFVVTARGALPGTEDLVAHASGALVGSRLEIPFLHVDGRSLHARYEGFVDLPGGGMDLAAEGRVAGEIDLAGAPRFLVPPGVTGRVRARGAVRFPSDSLPIELHGTAAWERVRIAELAVPDGEAAFRPDGLALGLEARLEGIALEARISAESSEPRIDAAISWSDVEAIDLLGRVLERDIGLLLAAWTDGNARLSGPLADPSSWSGRGEISRLVLEGPSVTVRQARPAPFVVEGGGRVRLDGGLPLVSHAALTGGVTIEGSVDLLGEDAGSIELSGRGQSDLRFVEVFDPDLVASGDVEMRLAATGTLAAPLFDGEIRVERGRVRHLTLNEAVEGLTGRAVLEGSVVRLVSGSCGLGGGTVQLDKRPGPQGVAKPNEIVLDGWVPDRIELNLLASDVALTLPRGVFGRYNAELRIEGAASEPEISGRVDVLAARYMRPFGFGRLFGERTRTLDPSVGFTSWMSRVGLRLGIVADRSFVVDNDMARLESSARLGLEGTLGQPTLSGTIALLDGGRVDFRGVEYEVLSGQVLLDQLDAEPVRVRLRAVTDVSSYRIRLDLEASTETVEYKLSSTPALPEADILSLLISGETVADRGGSGVIGADLATAYFGSELGELLLSGAAQRLLGLTHFQLAPSRVGPDARPTARLTLGRRIDDRTLALYSRDLSSEGEDVYRLERELTRRLRLSLSQESRGGVGVDLRWLKRFGDPGASVGDEAGGEGGTGGSTAVVRDVEVRGLPEGVDEPRARGLGLRRGRRLRRADLLVARDALRRVLVRAGYFEARVGDETTAVEDDRVDVVFHVDPGERWTMTIEGPDRAARRVEEVLTELWSTTQFRPELLREAERVVKEALSEEGFAAASIAVDRPGEGARQIAVRVDPGPRVTVGEVRLEGVDETREQDVLGQILSRPAGRFSLGPRPTYKPRLVLEDVAAVRAWYESIGYLSARVVSRDRITQDGDEVVLIFDVEEDEPAQVGNVRVEGEWPDSLGFATSFITLKSKSDFLPKTLDESLRKLRTALDEAGYYDAQVVARPELRDGSVDVTFRIRSGPRGVVEELRLVGLERTRERLVRRQVKIEPGRPLTRRALRETERSLFRLGLFRDVDVSHAPAGADPERRIVTIEFQETPAVSFLGTIGFDTEEQFRTSAAVSHDNIAGMGRTGTLQAFASNRQHGTRATLEDTTLFRDRVEGLLSLGWQEEEREGFELESVELALEIGSRRDRTSRWRVGYELEDDRFFNVELDPDALMDVLLSERGRLDPIRLGALRGSWLVDRRDDPFLPSSGWIVRSDVGLWSRPLASEADFFSASGQLAAYAPWGDRVTLAASVRAGWAWPTRDTARVPLSERFFAGGADTIRGFDRDKLGPLDVPGGEPLGGESVVLVNLEGRIRLWPRLELATFVDAGNLWLTAGDLDLGDLRKTWGLSLRFRSAVGALRLGYARKFDPFPLESSGEFYISIGEPF